MRPGGQLADFNGDDGLDLYVLYGTNTSTYGEMI